MKLTSEQVQAFREEGVVVIQNVVTESDLAPLIGAYEKWIDHRAQQLQEAGEISDLHEGAPFVTRIGLLYEQTPHITDGLDITQARLPEMFEFLRNKNLLDAVQCLVGPGNYLLADSAYSRQTARHSIRARAPDFSTCRGIRIRA